MTTFQAKASGARMWREATQVLSTPTNRVIVGYDEGATNACLLFPSMFVPQDATVVSATLTLKAYNTQSGTEVSWRISALDADSAALPDTYEDAENGTRTTAFADWKDIPAWLGGSEYESPDLAAVVQEVVAREQWQIGNDVVLYLEDLDSDSLRDFYLTHSISIGALLTVEWTADGTHAQQLSQAVNWTEGDEDLWTAYTPAVGDWHPYGPANACLLVPTVDIPAGSTITNAYVVLTAQLSRDQTAVHWAIRAIASDDATLPATYAEAEAAPRTAGVEWANIPAWTAGVSYQSPNISDVIQEVVDREGWTAGQDMALLLEDDGSDEGARRYFYATASANPNIVPRLYIRYGTESLPQEASDTLTTSETIQVDKHLVLSDTLTSWDDEPVRKELADSLSSTDTVGVLYGRLLSDSLNTSESVRVDKHLVLTDSVATHDGTTIHHGDAAEVRDHPHTSRFYLAVKVPRIISKYTVTESRSDGSDLTISVGEPTYEPPFDGYVSTLPGLFDFLEDCTVWVGSDDAASTRTDHGKCRFRGFGEGTLEVAADMGCFWQSGDTVCLVDSWQIWPKFHVVDAEEDSVVVYKDLDITADQRAEYPVPIMGPPACAFIDEGLGYATVIFDGSLSYKVQPDSQSYEQLGWSRQGIASYAWTLEGADTPTPSDPYVQAHYATPGQYLAVLKVTDNAGLTSYGVRNVFIFDDEHAPLTQFAVQRLGGSLDDHGWEAEIDAFGDALDPATLPNHAQVVLFAEEWFAGVPRTAGYGGSYQLGRNNVKMVGWIADSRLSLSDSKGRSVSMVVKGLQYYLQGVENFPVYFTQADADAPAWSYFDVLAGNGLTVRKALYHLIQWHWTIMRFTDCYLVDDHNNFLPGRNFPEGSLAQQLDEFVKVIQADWAVDKAGALHVFNWMNYLPVSGEGVIWRERFPHILALDASDYEDIELQPRLTAEVARVRVEGVMASSTGWYGTSVDMAPGDIRGFRGNTVTIGNQILGTGGFEGSQGWELARAVYAERSSRIESVKLQLLGNYSVVDIVPDAGRVYVSLEPTGAFRGFQWDNKSFWVTGVKLDVDHEHGDIRATIEVLPETYPTTDTLVWGYADEVAFDTADSPAGGSFALPGALLDLGAPKSTLIPALMGDGSSHVEGAEEGTVYVRLFGDAAQTVLAENRILKPLQGRTCVVEHVAGKPGSGLAGAPHYRVVEVRRHVKGRDQSGTTVDFEGDASHSRAYQTHRGVMHASGRLQVDDTADMFLPVEGESLSAVALAACVRTAPAGQDVVVSVTRNGSSIGTVSIGAGQLRGTVDLAQPLSLAVGDVLDFTILQVGSPTSGDDLVVTVVCREYGI